MAQWFNNKQNLNGIVASSVVLGVAGLAIFLYKSRNKTATPHHSNTASNHHDSSSTDSFKSVESVDSFKSTKSKDRELTEEEINKLNPFYEEEASGKKSRRKLRKKRTRRRRS